MLKVHFDAVHGYAVPDGMTESFVEDIINSRNKQAGDYELTIGTNTLVTQFRLAVASNKIPYNEFVFMFNNKEIPVNKHGDPQYWPPGFADQTDAALLQLCRITRTKP